MKIWTKILVCLLALCIVLPFMASCNKKDKKPSGSPSKKPSSSVTETDPDANIVMPEVIDMDGYTYKAYVRDFAGESLEEQLASGNNLYKCIDFWIDEANSEQDVITFAVYTRNSRIEANYNCKIRQQSSNGSQVDQLKMFFANGDGFDLTIISAQPAAQAATQKLLRNLNDSMFADLSHASFDQNSINELSVANKLYFISGDMNISTLEVAGLSLVNLDFYERMKDSIVNDLFDGDPTYGNVYNLVTAQQWTMENMMEIATAACIDKDKTDGDDLSVIEKGDTIGYHTMVFRSIQKIYGNSGRKRKIRSVPYCIRITT